MEFSPCRECDVRLNSPPLENSIVLQFDSLTVWTQHCILHDGHPLARNSRENELGSRPRSRSEIHCWSMASALVRCTWITRT